MSRNVILTYSSSSNASFRGEIELNITRDEWDSMHREEQDQVISEELNNLVDIGVKGE